MNKKNIFGFGEEVAGYKVKVLNEREVRGASGMLLFFAMLSVFFGLFLNDFIVSKIFVTIFLVDFIIRVLINPKFSPTLILSRIIVSNQVPEYVGAPQKKFAWTIGLLLSSVVFIDMIIFSYTGIFNCLLCIFCLIFLFFESVFGICLGCKMYDLLTKNKSNYCPGGVCEPHEKKEIQKVNSIQVSLLIIFLVAVFSLIYFNPFTNKNSGNNQDNLQGQCDLSKILKLKQ